MARWVTINWVGKFRFRGNKHVRTFEAKAENEKKARMQILDYIMSMGEAGFELLEQSVTVD